MWALCGGLLLALALALLDADSGLLAWWRTRHELREAQTGNAALAVGNAGLRAERDALESDPFALERAIREDLGWARPGEAVVRLRRPGDVHANPRFP